MAMSPTSVPRHEVELQLAEKLYSGIQKEEALTQLCLSQIQGLETQFKVQLDDAGREKLRTEYLTDLKKAMKKGYVSEICHKVLNRFSLEEMRDLLQASQHNEQNGERVKILKNRLHDAEVSDTTKDAVGLAQTILVSKVVLKHIVNLSALFAAVQACRQNGE